MKNVFGSNRVDYYLIPYPLTQHEGEITIDWSKNRKDFVLAKLPLRYKLNFITDTLDIIPLSKVDSQILENLLLREFSFKGNFNFFFCE